MAAKRCVYDRETRDIVEMFAVDAAEAVRNHPDRFVPWELANETHVLSGKGGAQEFRLRLK